MKTFSVRTVSLALTFLCLLALGDAAHAQMYKGTQLVKADLLADTTAIAPGKPFTVGLRLKMAPKWHTYWQNSGDAGLPTKIDWHLPAGFTAGPILWPIPTRIDSPGDIVNYGYGEEVVLLAEITPPAQLPPGEVDLKGKASWLVCADLCVPGDAELSLKLPAGGEAAPANAQVFAPTRALLPRADHSLNVERKMDGGNLILDIDLAKPGEGKYGAEFFPLPPEEVEVGHPTAQANTSAGDHLAVQVKLPITSKPEKAGQVAGVLVVTGPDGDKAGFVVPAKDGAAASVPAVVAPAGGGGNSEVTPGAITKGAPPSAAPTTGNTTARTAAATGGGAVSGPVTVGTLLKYLLLGLLGGLILNVMPCVLPVISLKLFSFVKQANEEPARVFRLGLAYTAGVFAWFLAFAAVVVGLKAAGRQVGYAFHLQNPWFIVALCVVVFVFSLNLLGVFEFVLPGVFGNALAQGSERRDGYAGAFFQGVLATVLGSACTAPIFGAALAFAFAQSAPVVFAMFAAIAAGMSSPFVLLAARPQWLRLLPRPGAWMERVKQATGFLMLATVLWLLSILGAMKGADAVVWMGLILLVLGVACWIQGSFNTLVAPGRTRATALAVMLALVAAGGWLGIRQIGAAQLPAAAAAGTFSDRLQTALKTGQPVFVDFTADWCVNCKVNERVVLSTPTIQNALKGSNTLFLTADWTVGAPDITALLQKFGRAGVPLYVIYPADRSREPIVLPELLTQQIVLDGLKSAGAAKGQQKLADL